MAKKTFYEEAAPVEEPMLPLVDPCPKFNNLLLHEQPFGRKLTWPETDMAKLDYSPEGAANAAYFYLLGIRRLGDPLNVPRLPKKWPFLLFTTLLVGMGIMYYIFHI